MRIVCTGGAHRVGVTVGPTGVKRKNGCFQQVAFWPTSAGQTGRAGRAGQAGHGTKAVASCRCQLAAAMRHELGLRKPGTWKLDNCKVGCLCSNDKRTICTTMWAVPMMAGAVLFLG